MGVRIASSANNTILAATPANGVETIIATTGALGLALDNAQVLIMWAADIAVGVGATALTFRIRRGAAVTSALVNIANVLNMTASTQGKFSMNYSDQPGIVAGLQYSLTVTVTGGGAVCACNDVSIAAIVL